MQAGDVARAIAWVQKRAPLWPADPARLVVLGHSTGAHLGGPARRRSLARRGGRAAPWLATIVLDSATLDAVALMRAPHRPLHDRAFGVDEAVWETLSPCTGCGAGPRRS
jgi:acetyl esterase/lipase